MVVSHTPFVEAGTGVEIDQVYLELTDDNHGKTLCGKNKQREREITSNNNLGEQDWT